MIFRSKHKGDYTRINNAVLRDSSISDGARSLLVYMLSMSDEWSFSVKTLASYFDLSVSAIVSRIGELKKAGYIKTRQLTDKQGRFTGKVWDIYEEPQTEFANLPHTEKTEHGKNRIPKKPYTEKTVCRKTNIIRTINIKEQSNVKEQSRGKKAPAKKCPLGPFENVLLTNEEQKDLTDRLGFDEVVLYIDRLSNYLHEHPEKKYKSHKATIERWIRQDEGSA